MNNGQKIVKKENKQKKAKKIVYLYALSQYKFK